MSLLLCGAISLQALEGIQTRSFHRLSLVHAARLALSLGLAAALVFGRPTGAAPWGVLWLLNWAVLLPYGGLFNGGSDAMTQMILLSIAWGRGAGATEEAMIRSLIGVGVLSLASYFLSGIRKALRAGWWNGRELRDFLSLSRVQVGLAAIRFSERAPVRCFGAAVVLFQVSFPLLIFSAQAWRGALLLGGAFHLANFAFFGLNRFFWVWISTYPALAWIGAAAKPWE